ncbi:MAG: aldo/keto reductase [Anaerolineaceae bacterium]|nr:aldo/keto reductase [Anaerolineaceae bacterium]
MEENKIFKDVELGIGTWAWGDRLVWNFGQGYSDQDIEETFQISIDNGIRFFDTAEIYGQGRSEQFLGRLLKNCPVPVVLATKFMPYPWRLSPSALPKALKASLARLDLPKVQLYQMHMPIGLLPIKTWINQMAEVYDAGLIEAVGVSNYDLNQTLETEKVLQARGIPLAANQLEYHLLERRIEKNGLMEHCKEAGIKIIAYSPLAMGILSGKYGPENPPSGVRGVQYNKEFLTRIQPLIRAIKKIGLNHDGKTAAQVAINWVICKGALPIPGAKNAGQIEQNVGSTGWKLTEEEVALLDELSDSVTKKD